MIVLACMVVESLMKNFTKRGRTEGRKGRKDGCTQGRMYGKMYTSIPHFFKAGV